MPFSFCLPRELTFIEPKSNHQIVAKMLVDDQEVVQYDMYSDTDFIGELQYLINTGKTLRNHKEGAFVLFKDACDQFEHLMEIDRETSL